MLLYNASVHPQVVGQELIQTGQLSHVPDMYRETLERTPRMMVDKDNIRAFFKSQVTTEDINLATQSSEVLQVSSPLINCGVTEYTHYLMDGMKRTVNYVKWPDCRNGMIAGLYDNTIIHVQYHGAYCKAEELACVAEMIYQHKVCTLHDIPASIPLLSKFDAIVCHTEVDRKIIQAHCSCPERIHHIPQGMPPLFTGTPHASNKSPLIGFIGFMSGHKGLHKLVECIPQLTGDFSQMGCRVVSSINHDLAGQAATDFARNIHKMAEMTGIYSRFEWVHDHLSPQEMQQHLAACDLLVLPYLFGSSGGSSAALRMALSTGVPVVCSDVPILMDIDEGVFRFTVTDVDNLADHIRKALRSDLAKKRDEVRHVVERDSWVNVAKRTEALYDSL